MALLGRALSSVAERIDSSITFNWLLDGEWSGHTPQILVSMAVCGDTAGRRTGANRATRDQLTETIYASGTPMPVR